MNRIVLAWLLSVVLVIPYVAKSIHAFQNEPCGSVCSHAEDNHNHSHKHDCDTCLVCQFVFSSFTEADFDRPDNGLTEFGRGSVHALYSDKKYDTITHLNYLRAPPLS